MGLMAFVSPLAQDMATGPVVSVDGAHILYLCKRYGLSIEPRGMHIQSKQELTVIA